MFEGFVCIPCPCELVGRCHLLRTTARPSRCTAYVPPLIYLPLLSWRRWRPSMTMITRPFLAARSRNRGNSQLSLSASFGTFLARSNRCFTSASSLHNS